MLMVFDECFISDDVMFKKKINPNEPFHLFIAGGVGTSKTFTLMLLIQGLLGFYNKHSQLDSFLKNHINHGIHWRSNI
jgi:hypothetical protein